ncbi:MAG: hypothetical protein R2764_23870 [Bacteroidales bacterium]
MHLTVRMAWHDSNWNGKGCCNPEGNTYCTGAHSLLSEEELRKEKILLLKMQQKINMLQISLMQTVCRLAIGVLM